MATKLAHAFGRCPRSIAFLCALQTPLPRLWDAQLEQEANRANFEVDLCLDDEIAELEERASFITWLRDSTDAPEILKAAAKSMLGAQALLEERFRAGDQRRSALMESARMLASRSARSALAERTVTCLPRPPTCT